MAYLIIYQTDKEPIRHSLTRATTIGRALDCDICLNDILLSRRHCCIEPTNKEHTAWAAIDLNSRNGTRFGGVRNARHELNDGEMILAGSARIQFHAVGFVDKRPPSPAFE